MLPLAFRILQSTFRRFWLRDSPGISAQHAYWLAKAEIEAYRRGWRVKWVDDDDPDLGDHEYWCDDAKAGRRHSHEVLGATLVDSDGKTLESLWGIIDPTSAYARVIEAELASQALAAEKERDDNDRAASRYLAL